MPHYKDTSNKLHFIESTSFEYMLPSGCVGISDVEAEQLAVQVLTKEQLIPIAREARNAAENSDIEVFGVLWQVDAVARDRMRSTIETAAAKNVSPETTVNWILSDNSIRPSTAGDLQQVLVAYTVRLADIFQQYVAWMNSLSTEMFSYIGEVL